MTKDTFLRRVAVLNRRLPRKVSSCSLPSPHSPSPSHTSPSSSVPPRSTRLCTLTDHRDPHGAALLAPRVLHTWRRDSCSLVAAPTPEEKANRDQNLTVYSFNVLQCRRRMESCSCECKCRLKGQASSCVQPRRCGSGFLRRGLRIRREPRLALARSFLPDISARPSLTSSGRLVSFPVIFLTTPLNSGPRRVE